MDFKALLISIGQKVITFIEIARISVIFMGLPFAMAGAALALSITHVPISLMQAIAGMLAVFFVTGAVHTIDDYFDRRRDRQLWPDRQIPSRGITPKTALFIALACYGIGFTFAILFFNIFCVIILLIAAVWATVYTGYLREKYGYMTLPFAIGLFPIGGYVAFSPQTLWSDPIPWLLYIMVFFWQSAHILAYSPPHGIKNGKTVVPLFFKRFSPEITLIFAGIFAGSCMTVGIFVFLSANLSYFYLGVIIGLGILLICLSVYFSRNLTVKNCMFLVFVNSAYGWLIFLIKTLEFLYRYDMLFFSIAFIIGILMMLLTPLLGGFGMPSTLIEKKIKKI
ncbi:MAG: UbiA family prenyltransferase [Candidatus Helarchaeota archaeon]|nr:UbiA family prenyltransferase [Candidatus Helarchaeota archaeon]